MFGLRWRMSVWLFALWIKVTPDCTGKDDILWAVRNATIRKPMPTPPERAVNAEDN